eukprot:COSAG06_NODE_1639_length_8832_cov_33.453515_1_plen_85_part_00
MAPLLEVAPLLAVRPFARQCDVDARAALHPPRRALEEALGCGKGHKALCPLSNGKKPIQMLLVSQLGHLEHLDPSGVTVDFSCS